MVYFSSYTSRPPSLPPTVVHRTIVLPNNNLERRVGERNQWNSKGEPTAATYSLKKAGHLKKQAASLDEYQVSLAIT